MDVWHQWDDDCLRISDCCYHFNDLWFQYGFFWRIIILFSYINNNLEISENQILANISWGFLI